MTLAHELGHGVHQYLSRPQGILSWSTPLTTAETASIFGETLVFQDLLAQEKDPPPSWECWFVGSKARSPRSFGRWQ